MPRKPAGAVRQEHPPLPRRDDAFFHEMQGLSPRTREAVRRAEHAFDDLRPGSVSWALERWRRAAKGPACSSDEFGHMLYNIYDELHADAHWEREYWLELALRRLPPFAARELRRVLRKLDARHRRNDAG